MTPMTPSKLVYIVDDDDAVRESVTLTVELAGYVAQGYASANAFLAAAPAAPQGCLVLDVRMPEMDGLELLEALGAHRQRFQTIVVTGHGDIAIAVRAMKAGAVDFIEKPFAKDALLASIVAAFARSQPTSEPNDLAAVAAQRMASLSTRERQVLEGLVAGHANKVIAARLSVSPRTVEVYRARLMDKMKARNFAELVRLALAGGITPS